MNDDANFDPPPTQAMLLRRQTQRFKPSDTPRRSTSLSLSLDTVGERVELVVGPSGSVGSGYVGGSPLQTAAADVCGIVVM